MKSDLKKLDSFTLETSKNHLIRNFLRNGRVRVNSRSSGSLRKVSRHFTNFFNVMFVFEKGVFGFVFV